MGHRLCHVCILRQFHYKTLHLQIKIQTAKLHMVVIISLQNEKTSKQAFTDYEISLKRMFSQVF